MKIGYVGTNLSLNCLSSSTFRLASYNKERLIRTITNNLNCLQEILQYNAKHNIRFYRLTSQLIPFASHEVNVFNWQERYSKQLQGIGQYARKEGIRLAMHPDQFVVINSPTESIVNKSIKELEYHADILDLMGMDTTCKIQIHVGGAYGEKEKAILKFIKNYQVLPERVRRRLVIEQDDRIYNLSDCLEINHSIGISVVVDNLHHELLNNGQNIRDAIQNAAKTWDLQRDGTPMVDYSSQDQARKRGAHSPTLDTNDFKVFLSQIKGIDIDIMLEIKEKEKSALAALKIAKH